MTSTYIALGSNLGDSRSLVKKAIALLQEEHPDLLSSKLYQTEAVNCEGGPFINAVCHFQTPLSLEALILFLESIEKRVGKTAKAKNEARFIDLDLLFYGSHKYEVMGYTIPHIAWKERRFVLEPLLDVTKTICFEGETFDLQDLCNQLP